MNAIGIIQHTWPDAISGAETAYTGSTTQELQDWIDTGVRWKIPPKTAAEVEAAEEAFDVRIAEVAQSNQEATEDIEAVRDNSTIKALMELRPAQIDSHIDAVFSNLNADQKSSLKKLYKIVLFIGKEAF